MSSSPLAISTRSRPVLLAFGSATSMVLLCAISAGFLLSSGHDSQRCVEIVAMCIAGLLFLSCAVMRGVPTVDRRSGVLLLGFLLLGVASASAAFSVRHAVNEWSILVLLMMLVIVIAAELASDARRLHSLLFWTGIACGLYSCKLLFAYALALVSGYQIDIHSLAIGFSNARFLNHTQTALMPLIVLLTLRSPSASWSRNAWFVLAAFWWALLFVCEARASVLSLATGSVVVFVLRRSHAQQFVKMMAVTALGGAILYVVLFMALPVLAGLEPISAPLNVVARTVADPTSARNLLWKLAGELIVRHPWLGVGPQHFAHEGATLYMAAHPHNWVLQIALEWGIPSLLCLSGAIFFGARALVRSGARIVAGDLANQQMLATLQVACTAILVDGLLSGVIVMPQSQMAIVLVLGIACGWVRLQGGTEQFASPVVTRPILTVLVFAGLFGLIWSVMPDIAAHAQGDALTPAELAVNPATHWPRLWEAGYF